MRADRERCSVVVRILWAMKNRGLAVDTAQPFEGRAGVHGVCADCSSLIEPHPVLSDMRREGAQHSPQPLQKPSDTRIALHQHAHTSMRRTQSLARTRSPWPIIGRGPRRSRSLHLSWSSQHHNSQDTTLHPLTTLQPLSRHAVSCASGQFAHRIASHGCVPAKHSCGLARFRHGRSSVGLSSLPREIREIRGKPHCAVPQGICEKLLGLKEN
jgi:hypothetical protein